ncbi:MAG: hypothetical protein OXC02_00120 [Rhodobacteraceae bacterium]|nr:hypothetical protein [Paracoccaceae bacterium]
MSSISFIEFDADKFSNLQRNLLKPKNKGSEQQCKFLERVIDSSNFCTELEKMLPQGIEENKLPDLVTKMTEAEFKDPPWDTEKRIYSIWKNIPPRIACRTTFWAYITYQQIKSDRIKSSYLVGGRGSTGKNCIHEALNSNDRKEIDKCIREVFRRLGGLKLARGNRSIYVDCILARAWWRERLVEEVAKGDCELEVYVRDAVRISQSYWEKLVTFIVSRNSVFGSTEIRSKFIKILGEELATDPNSPMQKIENLVLASKTLSSVQASLELSILDPKEIEEKMLDIINSISNQ